jgi:hypothetical protein
MVAEVDSDRLEDLLRYLATCETVAPSRASMMERLGLDADALDELLCLAVVEGECEEWEHSPCGPTVVLSSRSATRLGLELAVDEERGAAGRGYSARWVPRGSLPPERSRRRRDGHADADADLGDVEAPPIVATPAIYDQLWLEGAKRHVVASTSPGQAVSGPEMVYRLGPPPRPRVLIGIGVQWPPPAPVGGRCEVCRGRLRLGWYCLGCDRTWYDRFDPVRAPVPVERPRADGLGGGIGRKRVRAATSKNT